MTQTSTPSIAQTHARAPVALGGHPLRLGALPARRGGNDFLRSSSQYLLPVEPPPSIRRHRHYHSASSGGSVRSERGGWVGLAVERGVVAAALILPISQRLPRAALLRPPGCLRPVGRADRRLEAERHDRAHAQPAQAGSHFVCPVPGCGSTFTRSFT
ncbi:hypothetical protein B0H13DRAFT_1024963 [Mycena leptocephala]|nr:hypothetical protein B0H13DRAFT_1024963 [Mycena leptocephala]